MWLRWADKGNIHTVLVGKSLREVRLEDWKEDVNDSIKMGLRKVGSEDGKWMNYLGIVSTNELPSPWCWTSDVWYHRDSRLFTCKAGVKFFPVFSKNRNFDIHWCILGEDINVVLNNLEINWKRCINISLEIRQEKNKQWSWVSLQYCNWWQMIRKEVMDLVLRNWAWYIIHMMLLLKPTWFVLNGIHEVNNKCV
jgi:hypothetical protein